MRVTYIQGKNEMRVTYIQEKVCNLCKCIVILHLRYDDYDYSDISHPEENFDISKKHWIGTMHIVPIQCFFNCIHTTVHIIQNYTIRYT